MARSRAKLKLSKAVSVVAVVAVAVAVVVSVVLAVVVPLALALAAVIVLVAVVVVVIGFREPAGTLMMSPSIRTNAVKVVVPLFVDQTSIFGFIEKVLKLYALPVSLQNTFIYHFGVADDGKRSKGQGLRICNPLS